MLPVVGTENSFLETFFSLGYPKPSTGNHEEDVDEDTPANTSYVWKEIRR